MLLPLGALELSDKVQTYGAYAGFASVLGLAVLSLLYFGQARELRRLREWAGRAPERAAELQERVQAEAGAAAEASKRVVAQPAARPAAATSAAQAAAAKPGASPAAPAVPAVPAANPGAPGALSVPPSTAAGATAAAAAGATTGAPAPEVPTDKPAGATGTPAAPADGKSPAPGQPTVVQGGLGRPAGEQAGGVAAPMPSSPPPTGGGTGELVLPHPHAPGSTQESGETAVPLRRVSAGATLPPRPTGGGSGGGTPSGGDDGDTGGRGTFAIVAGVVAVLIIGAIVGTQLLGGDDEPTQPNAITTAAPVDGSAPLDRPRETTNTTKEPEVARGNVSVAVLNGTTITGLARGAANKIEATGYKIAKVGDNSVQTIQTSSVQFTDGSRRAAEDVAKIAGIPTSALAPMDAGTRVVAGEEAVVVVIVGADQSQ